jgi:putative ATPase
LTLVGATTEHPAFEVNAALLSRTRVVVLHPIADDDLRVLLRRALADPDRGLGGMDLSLAPGAEQVIVEGAAGDARQALNGLEVASELVGQGGTIDQEIAREALQQRVARYDTSTAFQMLSAFHKSLRSSQGDAALYWAMRMIQAGEDPRTVFRRLVAAAYEDVGLADPQAGIVCVNAICFPSRESAGRADCARPAVSRCSAPPETGTAYREERYVFFSSSSHVLT